MSTTVRDRLKQVQIGNARSYEHIAIFPIFASDGQAHEYLTMPDALEGRFRRVRNGLAIQRRRDHRRRPRPQRDGRSHRVFQGRR